MESRRVRGCTTNPAAAPAPSPPLHTVKPMPCTALNRLFFVVYAFALLALFYRHAQKILHAKTPISLSMSLSLLVADMVLAFMWACVQAFRLRPVRRKEFPENLEKVITKASEFPGLDVFICTADPYKEPPMGVVNTALSVMAYDYPAEKISVYVSDDGGSALTLFAFMEAAKFATHWLPFCRNNDVEERSPEAYFASNHRPTSEIHKIKIMYESMRARVERIVERGEVSAEYISCDQEREAFSKWNTDGFTRQNHPTVIQVLLENRRNKDMPNLIYVSRQKSRTTHHHFKAGALNVLLRVSAVMTNAPIILTLDCDMFSNDPKTPLRALCYMADPALWNGLGYIQFPQIFHGLNKTDIYACENKYLFQINPTGLDGLQGPTHVGTCCFFRRRAFFGSPSNLVSPEIKELSPDHTVKKPIIDQAVLELAHHVASCDYEYQTKWGSKIGARYGSLVEDYYTGYLLHCEGWRSIFCKPDRAAFLGDVPITLLDLLNQAKRWSIGLLEVAFSRYSTVTFGVQTMGLLMGLGYSFYAFWPILSIPITTYAFLPQLALLNGVSVFPKVSEPGFFLYVFLFLGAYGQDLFCFVSAGGPEVVKRWWSEQRMWMIKGLTCYLFGSTEYFLKSLGISTHGFNVTSKVVDDEQSKRYEQGVFQFGVPSPMFVTLTMAAVINLLSFIGGLIQVFSGRIKASGLFAQIFLAGGFVINCLPVYKAMALRRDKGKIPRSTTITAACLTSLLCGLASFLFKHSSIN